MSSVGPSARVEDRGLRNVVCLGDGVTVSHAIEITGDDNSLTIGRAAAIAGNEFTRDPIAISVSGNRNRVSVGEGVRLNLMLKVTGDDCHFVIGNHCNLTVAVNLACRGGGIEVGEGTTMVNGALQVHEPGRIDIGRDCMISTLVYISVSDIHPIYDRESGARINPAASVTIGDHVWLGLRSMILKGAHIDSGAVVAAGSIVSGHVPANVVVAGSPARVIRRDVVWKRDFETGHSVEHGT